MKYRPELDGLRALSVVAVMVYHLDVTVMGGRVFKGGYLGVDVFFVLSGYLITSILLRDLDAGAFSFRSFYMRRLRRLLPPVLLVMAVSIPVAWLVLTPTAMERFALSLPAALFFVSNVYWDQTLGAYGGPTALVQPFLHTWSLSIEEQFYLVFPAALLVLNRARVTGFVLLAGIPAGLWLAQTTTEWNPQLSFYLPTSRAWELLAGGALAWIGLRRPGFAQPLVARPWLCAAVAATALAVLIHAFATQGMDMSRHPGFGTVPAVLATVALLAAQSARAPTTRLLSSAPFVAVGRLSYSLYLWHFPVYAFGRLISFSETPTPLEYAAWVAVSTALAVAGYRFVERPFRFRASARTVLSTVAAASVAISAFAWTMVATDGYRPRLERLATLYGPAEFDNQRLAAQSHDPVLDLEGGTLDDLPRPGFPSPAQLDRNLFPQGRDNVLIVGNSHAENLFAALQLNAERFDGLAFAWYGFGPWLGDGEVRRLLDAPSFKTADTVVYAPRYDQIPRERHARTLSMMAAAGKRVIVVGNTAEFRGYGQRPVYDWGLQRYGEAFDPAAADALAYARRDVEIRKTNAMLLELAQELGLDYLSRYDLMCDDQAGTCTMTTAEGRKTLFDYGHWTLEGARLFGARAAQEGWGAILAAPTAPPPEK